MRDKVFNIFKVGNQAVQNAYAMLAANVLSHKSDMPVKTVAITGCRPGEGKTSIAIGSAIVMAASGRRVLLVDADIRKPNEAKRINGERMKGFTDYMDGTAEIGGIVYDTNINNLSYVPSGNHCQDPSGIAGSPRIDNFMSSVCGGFDFVLFDAPSLSSVADGIFIASKVDMVLVLAEFGITTLLDLKRARDQLMRIDAKSFGVVINKAGMRDYRKYHRFFNYYSDPKRFTGSKKAARSAKNSESPVPKLKVEAK